MSRARKSTAKSHRLETKPAAKSKKAEVLTKVEDKPKSAAKSIVVNNSGTKISKLPQKSATAKVAAAQMTSLSISQSLKSIREASTSLRSSLLSRSGIASLILVATALLAGGGFLFGSRTEQVSAIVTPAAAPMAESPVVAPAIKKSAVAAVSVERAHKKAIVKKAISKKAIAKKPVAKSDGKEVAKSQAKTQGKKQTRARDRRHADRRMVATNQY